MSTPTYTEGTFCWNELGTKDRDAARNFYTALFGWKTMDKPMPNCDGTYTLLNIGEENAAGMYQMDGEMFEGVPSHWMSYIWVDDVDASAKRITELGGKLNCEPMDIPGVGRMAMAVDPTGANFAIFKGSDHKGAAHVEGTPQGTFCWNECYSSDAEKATKFYCDLFGWTVDEKHMMNDMKYTMLMKGDKQVGGLMQLTEEMGPMSYWMSYVTVDDCDAKALECEKLGGKLLAGPMDVPEVGRFAAIQDPTGAVVSIIKLNG